MTLAIVVSVLAVLLLIVGVVALVAAPRALVRYLQLLSGRQVAWDKTSHAFPDLDPEQAA